MYGKNYPLQIPPDYLLNAPFTQQLCKEDVIIDGPAGKYEIAVGFIHGAAPACGQQSFWVGKKTQLPYDRIKRDSLGKRNRITCIIGTAWRNCSDFLGASHISTNKCQTILVGDLIPELSQRDDWKKLLELIYTGSIAIFLTTNSLKHASDPLFWLPLEINGRMEKPNHGTLVGMILFKITQFLRDYLAGES